MPLHGFTINDLSFAAKLLMDAARTVERPSRVDLVDAPLDGQFLGRRQRRLVIQTGPRDREQIGLGQQGDFLGLPFEEGQALISAQGRGQIFF